MVDSGAVLAALGEELKMIRLRKGLSRARAAQLVEQVVGRRLSRETIAGYENADREMPFSRMVELAWAYQVPPTALLRDALHRAGAG